MIDYGVYRVMRYISAGVEKYKSSYICLIYLILAAIVTVLIGFVYQDYPLIKSSENFDFSVSKIFVKISGDIVSPGIYVVGDNSMTDDVIKMANNSSKLFNYSKTAVYGKYIRNGSDVKVSSDDIGTLQVTVGTMPVKQRILLHIPLEISEMSVNDLLDVPGIGPGLANNIVNYRQKNGGKMGKNDLLNVSGIGSGKYNQLKNYFN